MAKFNGNILNDNCATDERMIKECIIYFQECLSKEDLDTLRKNYRETDQKTPWWKYVFENVKVTL